MEGEIGKNNYIIIFDMESAGNLTPFVLLDQQKIIDIIIKIITKMMGISVCTPVTNLLWYSKYTT